MGTAEPGEPAAPQTQPRSWAWTSTSRACVWGAPPTARILPTAPGSAQAGGGGTQRPFKNTRGTAGMCRHRAGRSKAQPIGDEKEEPNDKEFKWQVITQAAAKGS